ncbi:hypothetical protein SUGI_0051100 [Cryptomeria japonica]|uniref:uncharacterized protein LOC131070907 n=1 Tax=Cryptomeria japonica TaxID=3369 RepID=UPI002408CA29|nr:uncharacterized protein LOC131070907 [Cryptomeria japonica]GLJ06878.1 hypothetical protein SUGI_0051100 [Cryptomeria japonica]
MENGNGNEYPIRKSRSMGTTESSWCAAVDSGTGTSISGILLGQSIDPAPLRAAISTILSSQPLLRSWITEKEGQLRFDVDASTLLDVEVVDKAERAEEEDPDRTQEPWLQIVEDEMDAGFPKEKPFRVFQVKLYRLPDANSLIILRFHTGAADFASAVRVCSELMKHLKECLELNGEGSDQKVPNLEEEEDDIFELQVPSLEAATPPAKAKKSFWAHGIDVLGYGLASFRHALLPLENVVDERQSRVIVAEFKEDATRLILELCKQKSSDLNGLLDAAALKAVAKFKGTGKRGEHYAVVILLNCRSMLEPAIPDSTSGFYNAAIMKTIHATETVPLWELATRITKDFDQAVKNNKHFTDMGDLNMLMTQAITRPAVTPSSSMRTAFLSNARDACREEVDKGLLSSLSVKDWITCTSLNGIGPCLALYPVLRNGCLRVSFVYCNPLFSTETIKCLVDDISSMLNDLDK